MKQYFYILAISVLSLNVVYGQETREINTTNEVGTLPGSFGVSPTGAATYAIPIDLPEGRAGMTPQLALVYNSQMGDGILGKGWMLSGLSYIGRVIETPYYNDGNNGPVDFSNDQFTLNDNRLVSVNSNVPPFHEEYHTEVYDGSRIFSKIYGTASRVNNIEFVQQTANGWTLEYGSNQNSRQVYIQDENPPIRYYLTRVYDKKGNTIEYKYLNDGQLSENGELYIDEIQYTLSQDKGVGDNNFYRVKFNYEIDRGIDHELRTYFNNNNSEYHYSVSKLLTSISISFNNQLIKKYDIEYSNTLFNTLNNYHIWKVKLETADGKTLQPTSFIWQYNDVFEFNYSQTINEDINSPYYEPIVWTIGDVNGDGYDDIIEVYDNDEQPIGVAVKLGPEIETTSYSFTIPSFSNSNLSCYDINGDGKSELLIAGSPNNTKCYSFSDNNGLEAYLEGSLVGIVELGVDFTANGIKDVITKNIDGEYFLYEGNTNISDFISSVKTVINYPEDRECFPGDFDGDGKIGICALGDQNSVFYEFNLSNNEYIASEIFTDFTLRKEVPLEYYTSDFQVGDFNGDGKSDIFQIKKFISNESNVLIHYSFGHGFDTKSDIQNLIDFPVSDYNQTNYIADLNNDGITDILTVEKTSPFNYHHLNLKFYKHIKKPGIIGNFVSDVYEKSYSSEYEIRPFNLQFGDFSGNAEPDIHYTFNEIETFDELPPIWRNRLGYKITNEDVAIDALYYITNGFGVQTEVFYKRNEISPNSNTIYPKLPFTSPIYIAYKNVVFNLDGGTFPEMYYEFKNPVFHAKGKGFLGFLQTTVKNYQNNTVTNTYMDILVENNKYFHPYAKTIEQYVMPDQNTERDLVIDPDYLSITTNEISIKKPIELYDLVYFPVATHSHTNTWDMNQSEIGTTKSIVDIDDVDNYANILKSTNLVSEKILDKNAAEENYYFKTIGETEFGSEAMDETNWLMQRPTYSKTTKHFVNDDIVHDDIIEKDFIYYEVGDSQWPKLDNITTTPNSASELQTILKFDYDAYGNTTKETLSADGVDKVKNYEFSDIYNGRFLTRKWMYNNEIPYETIYDYFEETGLLKTKTLNPNSTNPLTTEYFYDAFGKQKKIRNPNGILTINGFSWAVTSKNINIIPPNSKFYQYSYNVNEEFEDNDQYYTDKSIVFYDKFEREMQSVSYDMKDREIVIDKYYFSSTGRLEKVSEPHFLTNSSPLYTTYSYDKLGRIEFVNTPGSSVKTIYNGRSQTVETTTANKLHFKTKTVSALGLTESIKDDLGSIDYSYYSSGNIKSIDAMGVITTMVYDKANRQRELIDPSAGKITYIYNSFGQLTSQTDARNNNTIMSYDNFGRLYHKTLFHLNEPYSTHYIYQDNPDFPGFGKLDNVRGPNNYQYSYAYDELGRTIEELENIGENEDPHIYTYDPITKQIESLQYPSGYKIKYKYKNNGYLNMISDEQDNMLWEPVDNNGHGQLTDYALGNGLSTHKEFDEYGFPKEIVTGSIQDLTYEFDPETGNLVWREDNSLGYTLHEDFGYDTEQLNSRLTNWHVTGQQNYSINYCANGNIRTKTDVTFDNWPLSVYDYVQGKYAVSKVHNPLPAYLDYASSNRQSIIYNGFNKVKRINQVVTDNEENSDIYSLEFLYGPDQARKQTKLYKNNALQQTKYFIGGNYEVEIDENGIERKLHYIMGGDGLFAIYEWKGEEKKMYYIHKDYLGSFETVTYENGALIEKMSYDPWGRQRNPLNWTYEDFPWNYKFDRGYTGHQHLEPFGIINMNGRLYDPWLGRMLSPDPYVQAPSSLQNYNRYSYAHNNPLKYTDPDGKWVHLAIGAVIGGVSGAIVGMNNGAQGWDLVKYIGVGAAAGALTAGIGAGVSAAIAGSSFGAGFIGASGVTYAASSFGTGLLVGMASGATNGFVTGFGYTLAGGGSVQDAMFKGVGQMFSQAAIGGAAGGIIGGISASASGKTFWTGDTKGGSPKTLDDKLSFIYKNNKEAIIDQVGDVNVEDVYVGSSKNFKEVGYANYRNRGGDIYNTTNGKRANGLTKRILSTMEMTGGYETFESRVFISKNTVRQMWHGNQNAYETLYHEFWHVRDITTGMHSYISYNYDNPGAMLEFRAYQFNYTRTCDTYYYRRMLHFANLIY